MFSFLLAFCCFVASASETFDSAFTQFQPSASDLMLIDSTYIANHSKVISDTLLKYNELYEVERLKFQLHTLEYMKKANNHRRAVFNWQLISSVTIFVMVLVIVGAGLFFSAKQFEFTLKLWEKNVSTVDRVTESTSLVPAFDTSVKVTPSSMDVSSPVLGVTILTLSIVFFFLYLRYVYPIGVLSDKSNSTTETLQVSNTDE